MCLFVVRSTVLRSCSRQLHESIAQLLLWSDGILLDGDSAVVDMQQASDVISSTRHAVNVRVYSWSSTAGWSFVQRETLFILKCPGREMFYLCQPIAVVSTVI